MTNNDDEVQPRDPRAATVLAIHLVRQVLDEAYIIANAAQDSGEPWQYVSGLTKLRKCSLNETKEEAYPMLAVNKVYTENKLYKTPSKVVTSTPQKATDVCVNLNDHTLIGQGDEEFSGDTDESKSTSMFITHLFDMSDVERDMTLNEATLSQNEPNNLIMIAMKKIMDSFVDSAMNSAFNNESLKVETDLKESSDTITSSYSFLDDAPHEEVLQSTIHDATYSKEQSVDGIINKQDFARYENAFLTLNRDIEQYSDDDEEPVLQDPKGLSLQEIELMTRDSSSNVSPVKEEKKKELAAVSGVSSSVLGSKKSSIVRRCRTQGARLLACLRGWWWRRRIHGKRREYRVPGSRRGVCPLSPEARRRAASLLDERQLRSPTPTRSVIWKFNTINEALLHSSQWKGFASDMKSHNDC